MAAEKGIARGVGMKGKYVRTKPAWNKGQYNIALIDRVNKIIDSNSMQLTLGEIFAALVAAGNIEDTHNGYKKFRWHLAKARVAGQVDDSRISEGRGRKRYKGGGVRNKFHLGDKVRLNKHSRRTPEWLREELRLDTPRTITAVCNVAREPGFVPTSRNTLYYLGNNRMGSDNLEPHGFRAVELIPYVKGKVGRPKRKRHYNQNLAVSISDKGGSINRDDKRLNKNLVKSPSISCVNCSCEANSQLRLFTELEVPLHQGGKLQCQR